MNDKGRIAVRVLKRNASWPMYKPEELEECAAAPELSRNAAARRTRAVARPLRGCLPSSDSCRAAPRPACAALREGLRLTLVTTKGPRACSCVRVHACECARVLWVRAQSRCRCGRGRAQSRCRCGRGASPVPVQMWAGASPVAESDLRKEPHDRLKRAPPHRRQRAEEGGNLRPLRLVGAGLHCDER